MKLLKSLWKNKSGRIGIIIVGIMILIALFAPIIAPYDPKEYNPSIALQKPSFKHILGTDTLGADIFSQLIYGTRLSLVIGCVTGVLTTVIGAILGVVAGYCGKKASWIIVNLINVLLVIPTTPLMILLNKISSSYAMMIFIFVFFGWSGTARVIRAQILSIKNMNYIKYLEILGANKFYIIKKHLIPAVMNLLIMNCCLSCAGFMIAEAGLTFIGLGDPTAISWGKMLVKAQESAFSAKLWLWIIMPGVMIFIIVTGLMKIGYALENVINPRIAIEENEYKSFSKLNDAMVDEYFDSLSDVVDDTGYEEYENE